MKKVAVLGSTGFIGTRTLSVIRESEGALRADILTAHRNGKLFLEQIAEFRPRIAVMTDAQAAEQIRDQIPKDVKFLTGPDALIEAAGDPDVDIVLVAIVGIAGLPSVMAAIAAGHDVALANKESLITGGGLVMNAAKEKGVKILPVDSEHSAIFQCLQGEEERRGLKKILLTASGGPFRTWEREKIEKAKAADALKHPTWQMGAKITIDSATLMNKGLEVIEAGWLFGVAGEQIQVVVHPQSIIHSMIELEDNAVLAQLGVPDMRIPIQYALRYPERLPCPAAELDLFSAPAFTFEEADTERFPCLRLAREAMKMGGLAPTVLNAANEIAVEAYLKDEIGFYGVSYLVEKMLQSGEAEAPASEIAAVYACDAAIRAKARELLRTM